MRKNHQLTAKQKAAARRNGARGGRPREERRTEDFDGLREKVHTADPLAAAEYMAEALQISAKQVMADQRLTDRERRAELIRLSRALGAIMPKVRLKQAEDAIRGDRKQLKQSGGPQIEKAPR